MRERETREGRGRPLACLLLAHPFFLTPTISKRLLRRLSNVVLEIRSTTRKVFFHFESLALPTKSHDMKIRADGILIDIGVSLSEPDTE